MKRRIMASWYHLFSWRYLQYTLVRKLHKCFDIEYRFLDPEPEPPFILLANHSHISDPFIVGGAIKNPLHYLANTESISFFKKLGGALVGIIPKKKGQPDLHAVRKMFSFLKKGHSVGIFAEGDRSWDGETDNLLPNIPQLVKMARVPVLLARLKGHYLSWPRWAQTHRCGKIIVEFSLLPLATIKHLSKKDLYQHIFLRLYTNDVKDDRTQQVIFTGENLAEGVQYLLWRCPQCRKHDTIGGSGNNITCQSCGNTCQVNGNQQISPALGDIKDLKDWQDWQKNEITNLVRTAGIDTVLTVSSPVSLSKGNKGKVFSGGSLNLYKKRIKFTAPSASPLVFDINKINSYVDNFNKTFAFNYNEDRYYCHFNLMNSSKWIFFLRAIQNLK